MREIVLQYPQRVAFGAGVSGRLVHDLVGEHLKKVFVLTDPFVERQVKSLMQTASGKFDYIVTTTQGGEPTFAHYNKLISQVRDFGADGVIGVGGGSVLDLAKLLAALSKTTEPLQSFVGIGLIPARELHLVCIPTTSGAGSEASPNAILIDYEGAKKGIISPKLLPDTVYIDPQWMISLPPEITAYTGLDALTHCIEAYANKFAHPCVDLLAAEGIRLISANLGKAIRHGDDIEARSAVALGSYYGGLCLGPVNTAAVHALAYPLGTKFKIPHGLSNAVLLPYVLEFNLDHAWERYAAIGRAMGAKSGSDEEMARAGIDKIRQLIADCGMPSSLSQLNISADHIKEMAQEAMEIQRLLKNNVREVTLDDAIEIYKRAYQ